MKKSKFDAYKLLFYLIIFPLLLRSVVLSYADNIEKHKEMIYLQETVETDSLEIINNYKIIEIYENLYTAELGRNVDSLNRSNNIVR